MRILRQAYAHAYGHSRDLGQFLSRHPSPARPSRYPKISGTDSVSTCSMAAGSNILAWVYDANRGEGIK